MKKINYYKKISALRIRLISLVLALLFTAAALVSCAEKMTDAEAQSILADLVPRSQELNEVFWGDSLPLADPDAEPLLSVTGGQYYPVADDAKYRSIAQLKEAASKIFTQDYLQTVYSMAFEGIGSDENRVYPRFSEDKDGVLTMNIVYDTYEFKTVINPETAKIIERGVGYIKCSVEGTHDGKETAIDIILRLQDDIWLLDSPTY